MNIYQIIAILIVALLSGLFLARPDLFFRPTLQFRNWRLNRSTNAVKAMFEHSLFKEMRLHEFVASCAAKIANTNISFEVTSIIRDQFFQAVDQKLKECIDKYRVVSYDRSNVYTAVMWDVQRVFMAAIDKDSIVRTDTRDGYIHSYVYADYQLNSLIFNKSLIIDSAATISMDQEQSHAES